MECYPLPKQQLFSFIRSTCHPWTFRDLKNLPMIVFLLHSTPHLLIFHHDEKCFFSEPVHRPRLVFQTWQRNGEAEESSDESSVAPEWSLTWGDQAEPSERCKQGHLRVPLLNERFSKCQNNCGGDHKLLLGHCIGIRWILPLGVGMLRPNAPFANILTTLEGGLAKRKEREKEAGWVNKKLKTGRPASTRSWESVSIGETK